MDDKPSLKDPEQYPDDEVLGSYLGPAKSVWDAFMDMIKNDHPLYTPEWRYYKDGGNWLCKVIKKKKTICWVSVWDGFFKTTFYFGDKAEPLILESDLDQAYKDLFVNGKHYGKIRGITVEVREAADLVHTEKLMGIKEKLK